MGGKDGIGKYTEHSLIDFNGIKLPFFSWKHDSFYFDRAQFPAKVLYIFLSKNLFNLVFFKGLGHINATLSFLE